MILTSKWSDKKVRSTWYMRNNPAWGETFVDGWARFSGPLLTQQIDPIRLTWDDYLQVNIVPS